MELRLLVWVLSLFATAGFAGANDGKNNDRCGDGLGNGNGHNHGHPWHCGNRSVFIWTPGVYSTPFAWGSPAYDPYLYEQNLALMQLQRQQARLDAERFVQAETEARAIAVERAAALKGETRKKRAVAAATSAARSFAAGNFRLAAANYQEAASMVSDDANYHLMLAQSQFALKKFLDAAKSLRTAIQIKPDVVDFDVASLYKDADLFRRQVAVLADELRVNPLNRDAMFLLGHMLFVGGQKEKAKVILLEAERLGVDPVALKPYLNSFQPALPAPAR